MTIRNKIIETWGPLWPTAPLNPEHLGSEEYQGLLKQDVTIQTSPGERVPGILLTPPEEKRNGKGILCVHQHAGQWHWGKSEPTGLAGNPNMFYALELAQRGYTTFTIDLLSFEDRRADDQPDTQQAGMFYERFVATQLLMYGHTLKGRYVWDLHRALDYLAGQPNVEADHLGVIGHSLGGQTALDIMLFDQRIVAGVCSCGISTWESILRDGVNHNMAAYAPGLLNVADTPEIVSALCPRAFFMSAGEEDSIFPLDGVHAIEAKATDNYKEAGAEDRFRLRTFPGGHGFPTDVRQEAYQWLDRFLL